MIATSEPQEFIPHGRRAIARHPGSVLKAPSHAQQDPSETLLLYKLKNVAITDDLNSRHGKFSDLEENQNEWWSVRQICPSKVPSQTEVTSECRQKKDEEVVDNPIQKVLKNEFNASIKSELSGKKHNNDSSSVPNSTRFLGNLSSINSSKNTATSSAGSLDEQHGQPDPKLDCCYEEELYVKGNTAIWSKGLISNGDSRFVEPETRVTIACYTCETPIKHALFCNFHETVNNKLMFDSLHSLDGEFQASVNIEDNFEEDCEHPLPSICVMDSNCLRAFTEDGQDFITSLQFQVKSVWSSRYGILLEKEAAPTYQSSFMFSTANTKTQKDISNLKLPETRHSVGSTHRTDHHTFSSHNFAGISSTTFADAEVPLPTCFSLSHPLDEMAPVLIKSSQFGIQYYNDGTMTITFVCDSPSICFVYCSKTGLHSLYTIRKATGSECRSVCGETNKTASVFSPSGNFNLATSLSAYNTTAHKTQTGSGHKNLTANWLAGISSPFASKPASNVGSPNHSKTNVAGMFSRMGLSPHSSIGQASNHSMLASTTHAPPSQPLYPDLCLERIWTENQGVARDTPAAYSAASKTFLHCDHTGQHYLCYLSKSGMTQNQLQMAKIERPHSPIVEESKRRIIVGAVTLIPAKDAEVLPSLNTIAVIDLSGHVVLYSGPCTIGKVHISGHFPSIITSLHQNQGFEPQFPSRSSLLPSHSRDVPILDDSALHLLSPVPKNYSGNNANKTAEFNTGLCGLRDPVYNRITLQYDEGQYFRIMLPEITSSSLILKCIVALKQVLPKDIVMQVISKWYGIRNAPGTMDLCPKLEWSMFVSLMLNLLGYDISKLPLTKQTDVGNTEVAVKKLRSSCDGTQEDWEYLLNSNQHIAIGSSLASMLNLTGQNNLKFISSESHKLPNLNKIPKRIPSQMDLSNPECFVNSETPNIQFNTNSLLFQYMFPVLYSFHLVYEEIKMNVLLMEDLEPLAQLLHQVCLDLRLETFVCHFWKDFPSLCQLEIVSSQSQISEQDLGSLNMPAYFTHGPPNIFEYLCMLMKGNTSGPKFPFLSNVNPTCRDIVEVTGLIANGCPGAVHVMLSARDNMNASSTPRQKETTACTDFTNIEQAAVLMLCMKGYTLQEIQNLPPAIKLFILNSVSRCKANPPVDWPPQAYSLIMREDLALRAHYSAAAKTSNINSKDDSIKEHSFTSYKDGDPDPLPVNPKSNDCEKNTGLEHLDTKILRLRFPDDHRVAEVCNLLQSSIPVTIALTQRPEVSDHDFIEEQERHLYALCTRTMALPLGRGMVTLRSAPCVVTEPLQIPKLCATGRAPPRNTTIELSHIEVPPHYSAWPLFHNGVAAGLKIVPMGCASIESAWVVYNKPKPTHSEMPTEHAGFLMALGLNGHLKDMAFMNVYEYLVKCHEMTSVGLLLGIAATYRGTMDVATTKLLGIHVEALLPPTSIELDIPQNIQVAALLGVGLLYQRTAHTHITQVLLSEIGRPPGPEMENSSEREGYSLAAGLGLGLVCLGAHATAPHQLPHTLRHYMLGGNKKPLTGAQKEKYKLPSFQIREGPSVNVDVTAPGATLALGMLYMKSGNQEVARWLAPPPTHYLLDYVRPDLLLLRVIARGLILWDSIEPYEEWVEDAVPASIRPYCFVKPTEDHIDYEAMIQVYCNIVAGACFTIGLRFAGSANQDACDTIMYYARHFTRLGTKSIGELAGKSTIETCLNLVLISAAMVMAGTGDLQIMRLCRLQRTRAGPGASALTYGSQMGAHAALGLLFLGAGRYTLSTQPESVAALVCAFFPKFPTHSNDNRYHLQAFRHLYVLAIEPRLIIPRDIVSGKLCYANMQLVTLTGEVVQVKAPCLLPELHRLKEVRVQDHRYWSIVFKRDRNWDQLMGLLKHTNCLDIKQKAGCLSYMEDPQGFQSLLAQTLTTEKTNIWSAKPENIFAFSNDQAILNFTKHYLVDRSQIYAGMSQRNNPEQSGNRLCASCYFLGVKKLVNESGERRRSSGSESRKRRRSNPSAWSEPAESEADAAKKCICDKNSKEEKEFIQLLSMVTYECVIRDTLVVLPIWITFIKILRSLYKTPCVYHIWQMKLLFAQIENHNKKYVPSSAAALDENEKLRLEPLISNEFTLSIKQKVAAILDCWESELGKSLKEYMQKESVTTLNKSTNNFAAKLSTYITYYDIPCSIFATNTSSIFATNTSSSGFNLLNFFIEMDSNYPNLDSSVIQKIVRILMS